MRWYRKQQRYQSVKSEIAASYPTLQLAVHPPGTRLNDQTTLARPAAAALGTLPVDATDQHTTVAYRVALLFPKNFPGRVPLLFYDDPAVPSIADRHVMADGRACLCAPSDILQHWPLGSTVTRFIEELVRPHLVGQYCYGVTGAWPHAARSHGFNGLWEAYAERIGTRDQTVIARFILALRERRPRPPDAACPCGSGSRLRDCHAAIYMELRNQVRPEQVAAELTLLSSNFLSTGELRALSQYIENQAQTYGLR